MKDPFGGRGRWLLLAAAVGLAVTFGVGLFSEDPAGTRSRGADTFSRSWVGHGALVELLQARDRHVIISRYQTGSRVGSGSALLILEPAVEGPRLAEAVEVLDEVWQAGLPVVVVLPKWKVERLHPEEETWIGAVDLHGEGEVRDALAALMEMEVDQVPEVLRSGGAAADWQGSWVGDGGLGPVLPAAQTLAPGSWLTPLVEHGDGGTLIAQVEDQPLWIISDPDLLNNGGLALGGNGALALRFLDEAVAASTLVIDETHHGFELPPSIWRELFTYPLLLVSLHMLLLLGLLVWAASVRFGRPQEVPPRVQPGLGALIDNTARLIHRARHMGDTAERYFQLTVHHAARDCALPPALGWKETVARLGRLGRSRGVKPELDRLAQRVKEVQRGPESARRTLQLCRDLAAWRKEVTDGFR